MAKHEDELVLGFLNRYTLRKESASLVSHDIVFIFSELVEVAASGTSLSIRGAICASDKA